jgi:hypothetical protein
MRMPQARVPIIREPSRPAPESQSVARKQCQYNGMYSMMTLKLKVSSMAPFTKNFDYPNLSDSIAQTPPGLFRKN